MSTFSGKESSVREIESGPYTFAAIIICMRISAAMLELAEGGNDKNYLGQARLLRAAADDLESQSKSN